MPSGQSRIQQRYDINVYKEYQNSMILISGSMLNIYAWLNLMMECWWGKRAENAVTTVCLQAYKNR